MSDKESAPEEPSAGVSPEAYDPLIPESMRREAAEYRKRLDDHIELLKQGMAPDDPGALIWDVGFEVEFPQTGEHLEFRTAWGAHHGIYRDPDGRYTPVAVSGAKFYMEDVPKMKKLGLRSPHRWRAEKELIEMMLSSYAKPGHEWMKRVFEGKHAHERAVELEKKYAREDAAKNLSY